MLDATWLTRQLGLSDGTGRTHPVYRLGRSDDVTDTRQLLSVQKYRKFRKGKRMDIFTFYDAGSSRESYVGVAVLIACRLMEWKLQD